MGPRERPLGVRRPSTWYRIDWLVGYAARAYTHETDVPHTSPHTRSHVHSIQYYVPYGYDTVTPRSPSSDMPVRSTLAVRVKELPVFHLMVVVRCNRR